jgi:hypothetical protein
MCRRLKTSELIRGNSNAWTEVDAEVSLAQFPIFMAAACFDSTSTRHARVRTRSTRSKNRVLHKALGSSHA